MVKNREAARLIVEAMLKVRGSEKGGLGEEIVSDEEIASIFEGEYIYPIDEKVSEEEIKEIFN